MINRFTLLIGLLLGTFASGQDILNNYSYVVVPEQYDFVEGKDRYQLNSMTQFYLEKYGFNAYMVSKVPNVKRCDGLYADVVENRAILRTDLQIIFKDCEGKIVYKGPEGKSKYKEFKKAYQDALRNTLLQLHSLGVNQPSPKVETNQTTEPTASVAIRNSKPTQASEKALAMKDSSQTKPKEKLTLPSGKFTEYKREGTSYLLRQIGTDYALYRSANTNTSLEKLGTIFKSSSAFQFKSNTGETSDVYFDEKGNMTIFTEDGPETYLESNQ